MFRTFLWTVTRPSWYTSTWVRNYILTVPFLHIVFIFVKKLAYDSMVWTGGNGEAFALVSIRLC